MKYELKNHTIIGRNQTNDGARMTTYEVARKTANREVVIGSAPSLDLARKLALSECRETMERVKDGKTVSPRDIQIYRVKSLCTQKKDGTLKTDSVDREMWDYIHIRKTP